MKHLSEHTYKSQELGLLSEDIHHHSPESPFINSISHLFMPHSVSFFLCLYYFTNSVFSLWNSLFPFSACEVAHHISKLNSNDTMFQKTFNLTKENKALPPLFPECFAYNGNQHIVLSSHAKTKAPQVRHHDFQIFVCSVPRTQ